MHHSINDWVVQTQWLFSQTECRGLKDHGFEKLAGIISNAKRDGDTMENIYQTIKRCVWPWTIRRWSESKNSDSTPLVKVPDLVVHEVCLEYTPNEREWLDKWVQNTKEDLKDKFMSTVHRWRLACLSADLALGVARFRTSWDPKTFVGGPVFRWLETFLKTLTVSVNNGPPNKAVLFAPLPGHTYVIAWRLTRDKNSPLPGHNANNRSYPNARRLRHC